MAKIENSAIEAQLAWRYATKHFDSSRKISEQDWKSLERSLVLSPSSFGLQPWKFIVVQNAELRKKLRVASWNQSQIEDASYLVVLAVKKGVGAVEIDRLVERISTVRNVSKESIKPYGDMMRGFIVNPPKAIDVDAWSSHQVYIALGFFLSTAAMLGIDACPMEGIEPAKYNEILGLGAQGYHAVVVVTAGYRSADDAHAKDLKVRYETKEVVEYRM